MPRTNKSIVSLSVLLNLLKMHNTKFPSTALEMKQHGDNFILYNKNYSKTYSGIWKTYNYLKNRYYYNSMEHPPRLGYRGNKNAAKRQTN